MASIPADLPSAQRYTRVAIWLHWSIGLAVILNITLALLAGNLSKATRMAAMDIHKAVGITVLVLTVILILWRLANKPPALPVATRAWQRPVSKFVHFLFYALLILLPLSGWVLMSAAGKPIDFFGLFDIPVITGPDKALASTLKERHEVLGLTMLALVVIHILAALKHQFIDRTRLMTRMNPFG